MITNRVIDSLDDLVAPNIEPELIATGCRFTEGPVWLPSTSSLFFNDIPADKLLRWDPGGRGTRLVRRPNNKGNGMTLDNEGRLLVCEHATSVVARQVRGTDRAPIASHWDGKELNSPNDVIVASDGSVIFTDPVFGRTMESVGVVRDREQSIQGVYRLPPDGAPLELLVGDMVQPNGLCLSTDETRLYVGDTARAHVRVFQMKSFGRVDDGTIFASSITASNAHDDAFVDGVKNDEHDNIYVTGPGGIWVYAANGKHLGIIEIPEQAANLNWGDSDWKTLYITASTSVYRVRTKVAANRLGYMR